MVVVSQNAHPARGLAGRRRSERISARSISISDALPFGRLWYQDADAAVGYAKFCSRSQRGELRVFDPLGSVIHIEAWAGDFKET